jgi:hypothetical protein
MIHALKPLAPEPAQEPAQQQPTGGLDNPTVARCEAEWDRVYQAVLNKKKSNDHAILEANWAYREAMPTPVGYSNICNFIACVIYGMLMGRFESKDGTKLLYGAQVALNTLGARPRTQQ